MTTITTPEPAENPAAEEISGISSAEEICESPLIADLLAHFSTDRWESALVALARNGRESDWTLGDLLNATKERYGDGLYDRAAELTGYAKRHLENLAWVARSVGPSVRDRDLSISVHEAVAKLPPDQQEMWLDRAHQHGIPADSLRKQVKDALGGPPPDEPTRLDCEYKCPKCGYEWSGHPVDRGTLPAEAAA